MLINNSGSELCALPWANIKQIQKVMCVPHPAVMHRRSLFADNGNFDETFRIAGDYELLLRELKTNETLFY